ncbi:MAG: histidine phosphatase family protein [Candidatus Pacearchaeota archaeon]|nr:histidine phosphatase family protein [Candidatus Pacearchaeota archaeon]
MKLIIVRHGETIENKKGILQGQSHGKLNKLGKKQSKKLAERLANEKIDAIYCSDLRRCKETLEPLLKIKKQNVFYTPLLREIKRGVFEGKPNSEYKRWLKSHPNQTAKGMETKEKIDKRILKFINQELTSHKNNVVLIVTHGTTKKVILNRLLGNKNKLIEKTSPNTGITIVNILENKKAVVEELHYTRHLE